MITERLVPETEESPELVRLHLARYDFARQFVRGKKVLDVACGAGYGAVILQEAGAALVVGVDNSTEALAHARAHYQNKNLDFVLGNAEDLSPHRDFDVVVSFETIEHLQNPEKFLREITRALAPHGMLIISTPQRERGTLKTQPHNRFHVREWIREEFEELLSHYFNYVTVYGQYAVPKKWLPYSRTMQRFFLRVVSPQLFADLDKYPVLAQPPSSRGFRLGLSYMVMVCAETKGAGTHDH
ncbi:methyltransferase domain-containing protein [bacterium]|nr:methyltransferase domain-containing protein [bacterium]